MKDSAYKQSGVDIDAGAEVVDRIKPHVQSTFRSGVMQGLGGFGAFFDLKQTKYTDPVLVSSNDGVGTKLKIAIDTGVHNSVGIDLVAMCVNDLIVQGAEPLFFLDYFATGKLDPAAAEDVIAGIAAGCKEAGCALIGGETAEMPGMYGAGDYDLAGFTVGAVERDRIVTGERVQAGDVILALASSGPHSNGYSLIRRLAESNYDRPAPFQTDAATLGAALLTPTRIYVKSLLAALEENDADGQPLIKAMANITGGGLIENIPRTMPEGTQAVIDAASWELPPVFRWLKEAGNLSADDMARTLNCGIGMTVICAAEAAAKLTAVLESHGETVYRIGHIAAAPGEEAHVTLKHQDAEWA
ncbi:MAG: phosphoribosylformylglycinamidine cyclo-ligase [Rhodospirillales bacterium]|nr:phosphoribosylformylglycinamidine cyclo-ligase [Rhodospirillales bacterium]